jgi:hypothetical protein
MLVMTSPPREDVLRRHHVFVKSDSPFQRTVRLRQALWREKQGYPIGLNSYQPLGTRLKMPDAKTHLWNYLTDGIRKVIRSQFPPNDSQNTINRSSDFFVAGGPIRLDRYPSPLIEFDPAALIESDPGLDHGS